MTHCDKNRLTAALLAAALGLSFNGRATAQTFSSRTVNIPGASNILVTGINDSAEIVLNYADVVGTAHCVSVLGSTVTHIADPNETGSGGGTGTSCWGINNAGQIVGSYSTASFGNGFLYSDGVFTDIVVPGATAGTSAYGVNNTGSIVGSFADHAGQHGFLYTVSDGTYTTLDVPTAFATLALGINDHGTITFEWVNSRFIYSGAVLKDGRYSRLNVPGATQSKARGINVYGWINFDAQDAAGAWHGYFYQNGSFIPYDVSGAADTYGFGINSSGVLVGGYNPSATPGVQLGFEGRVH